MIRVIYDGNLGNNLFQYCFGRILAEKLGYRLVAAPLKGFPRTTDVVDGKAYESNEPLILKGQKPDLGFLEQGDPRREIILTGYFQRFEYYVQHITAMRSWLAMDFVLEDLDIADDDLVVGIRRGKDYIPQHGLPLSYYESALSLVEHRRVHICTDSPDDPFVRFIAKRHAATIRPPGALDNLAFIKSFNRIVISNSTFLWWGAFLSDAEKIIFPRPANGFWSSAEPLSKNIALEIPEDRFVYLAASPYRSEFLSENWSVFCDKTVAVVKSAVRPLLRLGGPTGTPTARWNFHED